MTDLYELLPKYQRLNSLCKQHRIVLDPEFGSQMFYQGQSYIVAAARGSALALIDEIVSIPIDPTEVIYVDDWENDPACVFLPDLEEFLRILRDATSIFPTITPGVRATREAWQVQHPSADPVVCPSLREALLEISLSVLENLPPSKEESQGGKWR
jgi:hypothetical protein